MAKIQGIQKIDDDVLEYMRECRSRERRAVAQRWRIVRTQLRDIDAVWNTVRQSAAFISEEGGQRITTSIQQAFATADRFASQ